MTGTICLLVAILATVVVLRGTCADENPADTLKLLQEQVNALLGHRQEDYNALERSLKRAIEKNTELFVLRNEVKQLRKEMNAIRGGNGNEAKNERLRVRWLGSAVTELRGEVSEVLRTMNASEDLAERSRMRSELTLLKGDVAEVGRGIRNLGGRIAEIEAALGAVRVDISAVRQRSGLLFRSYADITSQLSAIQMEVKSLKCESSSSTTRSATDKGQGGETEEATSKSEKVDEIGEEASNALPVRATEHFRFGRRPASRRHQYPRRMEAYKVRVEGRLRSLEHKLSLASRKRASMEKRLAGLESRGCTSDRLGTIEKVQSELSRRFFNLTEELTEEATVAKSVSATIGTRLLESLRALEETVRTNRSETKKELARLGLDVARKAAELSLTREELVNLRRAVQALSVSASKLQERSERQERALDQALNRALHRSSDRKIDERPACSIAALGCEDSDDTTGDEKFSATAASRRPCARPTLLSCRDGWIVVARRIDGSLDFDRTWKEYSIGFGSPLGEFWIGNELLHLLTRDNCASLRIDLTDARGERWRAEYDSFAVGSVESGYRLRIDGYRGNASDALSYQNGMAFSAKDRDLDLSALDCAANYHGGWWFGRCQRANLNGRYSLGLAWYRSDDEGWMSVASSEMSIKRKPKCLRAERR